MTADSGKRFTCIIPTDAAMEIADTNPSEETDSPISATESSVDPDTPWNPTNSEQNDIADVALTEESDEDLESPKSTEELVQEVDTPDNRARYLREKTRSTDNTQSSGTKKKRRGRNRDSDKNKGKSPCYTSKEGYWNYELCLFGEVLQFHGKGKKRDPLIRLGSFTEYVDVSRLLMKDKSYPYLYLLDIYGVELFEESESNFVHMIYTGGEAKRQSLVTIQCIQTKGKRRNDGIYTLNEPKIHHYHFVVGFNAACQYTTWLKREYNILDDTDTEEIEVADEGATSTQNLEDVFMGHFGQSDSSPTQLLKRGIDPESDDVSLLLSPLLDLATENRCLLLKQGWWTVEFCYGRFIRQIHLEAKKGKNKDGQIVQSLTEWDIKQEHVIGKWDERDVITKDSFVIHKNGNDPARTYASIVYTNGDECDLTKQPRKTEIQFRCGLNRENSELVKSREDPSCEYIAQVETPLLCGHPDFKIPSAPNYEIVCYPFDAREFVEPASRMKAVADVQSATDSILNLVTNAAKSAGRSHGGDNAADIGATLGVNDIINGKREL